MVDNGDVDDDDDGDDDDDFSIGVTRPLTPRAVTDEDQHETDKYDVQLSITAESQLHLHHGLRHFQSIATAVTLKLTPRPPLKTPSASIVN